MPAIKIKLTAAILLLAAINSHALTLGRMRGAALIGQGLEVVVQVQAAADESPAGLCVEAEVFHADARQDSGRVRVVVEPTQTAQSFNVRVTSTAVIDEPVVTVYLRAGCVERISRRYVMLADVVTEQLPPAAPATVQVPLVVPAPAPAVEAPAAVAGGAAAARPASGATAAPSASATQGVRPAAPAAKERKPARAKAPAAPTAPADEKLAAGRTGGQSRLKLDPLEVLSERVATLESSTANAPAEQAAREARDAERLQALEASVKNLLAMAARNEASLLELKVRLQQAESERSLNPVVYGLIALLVLSLAAVAFLLSRRTMRSGANRGDWWQGPEDEAPAVNSPHSKPAYVRPSGFAPISAPAGLASTVPGRIAEADAPAPKETRPAAPTSVLAPVTEVDVSLVEMSESSFDRLMQSGTAHTAVRKPRADDAAATAPSIRRRAINSAELFDIHQQAEFFVSLGQTDQAVRILENRISEDGESSPLAYLDLLKLFHSLGLRADYRQVREDFTLLFNAQVPEFDDFNAEGRGLEEYPEALAAITADWGMPEVFTAMEACIFRDQWKTQHEVFDLAAFRDLLLLHAVAQAAASPSDSNLAPPTLAASPGAVADYARASVPTGFGDTAPGGAIDWQHGSPVDVPLPTIDGLLEVDIDLSDLQAARPVPGLPKVAADAGPPTSPPAIGNLLDFDLSQAPPDDGPKSSRH